MGLLLWRLVSLERGDQIVKAVPKMAALFGERQRLLADGTSAEVLTKFIEHDTQPSGSDA